MFALLDKLDTLLWSYLGTTLIVALGCYLSVFSRFVQLRRFFQTVRIFFQLLRQKEEEGIGLHPMKVFFAAIGGAIGVGNIVGVATAVQIGGPGALFWVWVAAFFGMIIKYSEVFVGIRYRKANAHGSYDGGPMYFLKKAFNYRWIPILVSLLLCVYGVEIYIFGVVADSIAVNWHINRILIIGILLVLVIWGASGGVDRVGKISAVIIPLFLVIYLAMSTWVLIQNIFVIPALLLTVIKSAFSGHAAVGGFAGSYFILTMSQGIARGCYSGDIGIGYASIVHSESRVRQPARQASLAIFGIFLDTFVICTLSILLILLTNVWSTPVSASLLVQAALHQYFPFMEIFMPIFLFLLGYSTLITYLCVGLKCAQFISPKRGKPIYYAYSILALIGFSLLDSSQALTIMSISGGLLMLINLSGIYRLRKEIHFRLDEEDEPHLTPAPVN